MIKHKLISSNCPLSSAMATLGSKWKPIIIAVIRDKNLRFGQIAAVIDIISRKVLTDQLRELEMDGLIKRVEFKELPPRVEYSLTEKGLDLLPILKLLEEWDRKHSDIDYPNDKSCL